MNQRKLIIMAAECAVKSMITERRSTSCMVGECKDSDINHVKLHEIKWTDVLIGLRDMEDEVI